MQAAAFLATLLQGGSLSRSDSRQFFRLLFQERLPMPQARAVIALMAKNGESAEELLGCVEALCSLEAPLKGAIPGLVDTCGTGGDGSRSVNLSTLAALTAAGAGARIAKHGNRAITSSVGSSDLMEALGVRLEASGAVMMRAIKQCGIGYFHAPYFHPVFARVQGLRRSLGIRTIFNLLGPLVNPVKLDGQIIGVSRKPMLNLFGRVLQARGLRRAVIFRSVDGMDELSPFAEADCLWLENGCLRRSRLKPSRFGFGRGRRSALSGGDLKKNRALALALLQGKSKGPLREAVVLNAAAALWAAGRADQFEQGLALAEASLKTGRAYEAVQKLAAMTRNRKA